MSSYFLKDSRGCSNSYHFTFNFSFESLSVHAQGSNSSDPPSSHYEYKYNAWRTWKNRQVELHLRQGRRQKGRFLLPVLCQSHCSLFYRQSRHNDDLAKKISPFSVCSTFCLCQLVTESLKIENAIFNILLDVSRTTCCQWLAINQLNSNIYIPFHCKNLN